MKLLHFYLHLKTVCKHKYLVMNECFQLGLYKQGLLHDLSKFSPQEFWIGVQYFQGNRSPNNAEREEYGYSKAWLHHKGRNKHHYEYWIDYTLKSVEGNMSPVPMPVNYVVEMFLDRIAASKVYEKENYTNAKPLEYFLQGKECLMHEKSKKQLLFLLEMLDKKGEAVTFRYIKKKILKK